MKKAGEDWVTAVENIPPSRLSVEITGLEKGQLSSHPVFKTVALLLKAVYSGSVGVGGALGHVVPYHYNNDVHIITFPWSAKFITIMSVVSIISVIVAISQKHSTAFAQTKKTDSKVKTSLINQHNNGKTSLAGCNPRDEQCPFLSL